MNYKKITKLLAIIMLATQAMAALILIAMMMNESAIYRMYGLNVDNIEDLFVVPWTTAIPVFSHVCFAILLMVMVYKAKGKVLKICSIVFASALLLNTLSGTVQMIVMNRMAGARGVNYLAATSTISNATGMAINPLITLGTFLSLFVCGMCVCMKEDQLIDM